MSSDERLKETPRQTVYSGPRGSIELEKLNLLDNIVISGIVPYDEIITFTSRVGGDKKLLDAIKKARDEVRIFLTTGVLITTDGVINSEAKGSGRHKFEITPENFIKNLSYWMKSDKNIEFDIEGKPMNGPIRAVEAYIGRSLNLQHMSQGYQIRPHALLKQILVEAIEDRENGKLFTDSSQIE